MSIKYEKSPEDALIEKRDIESNSIMLWLKNQDNFKFSIGDVLIHQTKSWDNQWKTEAAAGVSGVPAKYVYVFENELGIGYLKQLRVNGSGFTQSLFCITSFSPSNNRFMLDPDYADHLLIGEGEYDYSSEYTNRKRFREEAMKKNNAMAIHPEDFKKVNEWFSKVKVGDHFWTGWSYDYMSECVVVEVTDIPVGSAYYNRERFVDKFGEAALDSVNCFKEVRYYNVDDSHCLFNVIRIYDSMGKIMEQKPYAMKDMLCGQRR